jgi:hypothetical protein
MAENAFVTSALRAQPWVVEESLIQRLSLPLNLGGGSASSLPWRSEEDQKRSEEASPRHLFLIRTQMLRFFLSLSSTRRWDRTPIGDNQGNATEGI